MSREVFKKAEKIFGPGVRFPLKKEKFLETTRRVWVRTYKESTTWKDPFGGDTGWLKAGLGVEVEAPRRRHRLPPATRRHQRAHQAPGRSGRGCIVVMQGTSWTPPPRWQALWDFGIQECGFAGARGLEAADPEARTLEAQDHGVTRARPHLRVLFLFGDRSTARAVRLVG